MKSQIRKTTLQLLYLCLEITDNTDYFAHLDYSGHVSQIGIYVYRESGGSVIHNAFRGSVYLDDSEAIKKLFALETRLYNFL